MNRVQLPNQLSIISESLQAFLSGGASDAIGFAVIAHEQQGGSPEKPWPPTKPGDGRSHSERKPPLPEMCETPRAHNVVIWDVPEHVQFSAGSDMQNVRYGPRAGTEMQMSAASDSWCSNGRYVD